MELYREILLKVLQNEEIKVTFENINFNPTEVVELKCYQALKKIKTIIENDSLEDRECFVQIEEIVCTFEELGSNAAARHDFG